MRYRVMVGGVMSVSPGGYMCHRNDSQFELIGIDGYTLPKEVMVMGRGLIDGRMTFARVLVRHNHIPTTAYSREG